MDSLKTAFAVANFISNPKNAEAEFTISKISEPDSFGNCYNYGDYAYTISVLGDGEVNGKFVDNITTDDCTWSLYGVMRHAYGMNKKEVDALLDRQPVTYDPEEAKAAQWAEALGFTD